MDKKELKKYGLTELESRFEELPPEYIRSTPGYAGTYSAIEEAFNKVFGKAKEKSSKK